MLNTSTDSHGVAQRRRCEGWLSASVDLPDATVRRAWTSERHAQSTEPRGCANRADARPSANRHTGEPTHAMTARFDAACIDQRRVSARRFLRSGDARGGHQSAANNQEETSASVSGDGVQHEER